MKRMQFIAVWSFLSVVCTVGHADDKFAAGTQVMPTSLTVEIANDEGNLHRAAEFDWPQRVRKAKAGSLWIGPKSTGGWMAVDKALTLEESAQDYSRRLKSATDASQRAELFKLRGDYQFGVGQFALAIADYSQAIELDPENPAPLVGRARAYFETSEYDKQVEDCTELLRRHPEVGRAYYWRARAYIRLDREDEASRDVEQAIHFAPQFADAYITRGFDRQSRGDHEQAVADCEHAIELEPLPEHYFSLALFCADSRENDKALAALEQSIARTLDEPDHLAAQVAFAAELLAESKQVDAAISLIDRAMQGRPKSKPSLLGIRGFMCLFHDKKEQALADFVSAGELDPTNVSWLRGQAMVLFALKRHDELMPILDKQVQLAPRDAESYILHAGVWRVRGRRFEAWQDLNRAIELDPKSTEALTARAELFVGLGRYEMAISDCDAAIAAVERNAAIHEPKSRYSIHLDIGAASTIEKRNEYRDRLRPRILRDWCYLMSGLYRRGLGDLWQCAQVPTVLR